MKSVIQFALRGYKRWISPMLPNACRFVPTCSEYAMEAVQRHGALRGSWLAACRLLRCHPFAHAGYDPVPPESHSSRHVCNFGVVPQSLAGAAFAASAKNCGHTNSRPHADGAMQ
jgi:putative membrane protein insertion efficiency factor